MPAAPLIGAALAAASAVTTAAMVRTR